MAKRAESGVMDTELDLLGVDGRGCIEGSGSCAPELQCVLQVEGECASVGTEAVGAKFVTLAAPESRTATEGIEHKLPADGALLGIIVEPDLDLVTCRLMRGMPGATALPLPTACPIAAPWKLDEAAHVGG